MWGSRQIKNRQKAQSICLCVAHLPLNLLLNCLTCSAFKSWGLSFMGWLVCCGTPGTYKTSGCCFSPMLIVVLLFALTGTMVQGTVLFLYLEHLSFLVWPSCPLSVDDKVLSLFITSLQDLFDSLLTCDDAAASIWKLNELCLDERMYWLHHEPVQHRVFSSFFFW